jgi:hypothetical protein
MKGCVSDNKLKQIISRLALAGAMEDTQLAFSKLESQNRELLEASKGLIDALNDGSNIEEIGSRYRARGEG